MSIDYGAVSIPSKEENTLLYYILSDRIDNLIFSYRDSKISFAKLSIAAT
jgi:hypothetical protein